MKGFIPISVCLLFLVAACTSEELSGVELEEAPPGTETLAAAKSSTFPSLIPLPNGFQPEGIAVGYGSRFYVGSIASGAVFQGDLRTGAGSLLVPPEAGRAAVGLSFDRRSNRLFVAGGFFGTAYVYDAETGATAAVYALYTGAEPSLVNDVVVTRTAAYFTDSFRPVLYRVPLGPAGELPDPAAVEELPLGGDFTQGAGGALGIGANGIDATPDGKRLVLVHTDLGRLYSVDPLTGEAAEIDLGGASVPFGDGLVLDGFDLYVVQNLLNQIAVVELTSDLTAGAVTGTLTSPDFRIPSTAAAFGSSLYAVNARFDVAPPTGPADPDLEFEVVQVPKP